MGYAMAGHDVVGVDLDPQPRYPFAFLRADVTALDVRFLRYFDFIHASPPCQFGTIMQHAPGTRKDHLNLIPPTRAMLRACGRPYVIENVENVRPHLIDPICLCGCMFDLGATTSTGQRFHLERRRLFECSFPIAPPSACERRKPALGMYGGHVRNRSATAGGRATRDFVGEDKPRMAADAMQMPWATMHGMSEAIPPPYTRYIAEQFALTGTPT